MKIFQIFSHTRRFFAKNQIFALSFGRPSDNGRWGALTMVNGKLLWPGLISYENSLKAFSLAFEKRKRKHLFRASCERLFAKCEAAIHGRPAQSERKNDVFSAKRQTAWFEI